MDLEPAINVYTKLISALYFRYSIVIPRFISALILLNPNNHYNHVFITLLTTTTLLDKDELTFTFNIHPK